MIESDHIIIGRNNKNIDQVNEYEIVGYNTIDYIDSDNPSEHIYFDMESTKGEKMD